MIHREGTSTLIVVVIFILLLNSITTFFFDPNGIVRYFVWGFSGFLLAFFLQFFRNPSRHTITNEGHVIAPADGKVVVIEEVEEPEFFKDKRLQVSIFMSPINVHVNRYPVAGEVVYTKYHEGKYMAAWHPKASTENERTTVVVKKDEKRIVLFRQVAGALARRIKMYAAKGDKAVQGGEFGFIKFGSRVDLYFPLGTKLNVQLDQVVNGGETVIAEW